MLCQKHCLCTEWHLCWIQIQTLSKSGLGSIIARTDDCHGVWLVKAVMHVHEHGYTLVNTGSVCCVYCMSVRYIMMRRGPIGNRSTLVPGTFLRQFKAIALNLPYWKKPSKVIRIKSRSFPSNWKQFDTFWSSAANLSGIGAFFATMAAVTASSSVEFQSVFFQIDYHGNCAIMAPYPRVYHNSFS